MMRNKTKSLTKSFIFLVISTLVSSFFSQFYLARANTVTEQEITIKFAAKVGDKPFSCGQNYQIGKPATKVTALDFRFYIADVQLIDSNNKPIPLKLTQDGKWQYQNVALLDFEDKTGACTNGTVETRNTIIGKIPSGQYKGIKFTLGVPENLNHEDSTLAPSPLNLTSLWWNWRSGYKFARIDFSLLEKTKTTQIIKNQHHHKIQHKHGEKDTGNAFFIHLGSTGCQAESANQKPTTKCSNPNTAMINLSNFDPSRNKIVVDVAQLLVNTNVTRNQANTAPGCMAEPNDADCKGIMAGFGIPFAGEKNANQTFFSVK